MRIDVWSDVVCPWCYLGKRRLDAALDELGWRDEVTVRWRAFRLDPSADAMPRDLRAAIERKYGPGAFDAMTRRLTALGAAEGIEYRFDRALRVGTSDAHRLLAWAYQDAGAPAQDRLADVLFDAYFTQGANVADHDTLRHLATEAALDGDLAGEVLASSAFADEVAADQREANERDITGVPAFVIAERLVVPGAQEVATLVSLLGRARERFTTVPARDAEVCTTDDVRG